MTDVRQRVEEDRGLVKKIELFIPGFRGYRQREDLRQADSIMRLQVADQLLQLNKKLETVRQDLISNFRTRDLESLGMVMFRVTDLEGKVRHAEQGYSGFAAALNVKETELNRLYEYDLSILEGIKALGDKAAQLDTLALDDKADLRAPIMDMRRSVEALTDTFHRRIAVITNSEVA